MREVQLQCEVQRIALCSKISESSSMLDDESSLHESGLKKSPSTASTLSINDSISSIESLTTNNEFRKVRFCVNNDIIIDYDSLKFNDEDSCCTERWYKREELRQFKLQAKQTAQLVRSNPKLLALIQSSHDLSIFIAEYGGGAQEAPDMGSVATILAGEVKAWAAATLEGDPCRGLESILLREQRGAFAQDARNAVVEGVYWSDEEAQSMAKKYQSFSTPATTFAQAMAQADVAVESSP